MIQIFFEAISGDPIARQHVIWIVSQFSFWLVIIKWGLILFGLGIVFWRLSKTKRYVLLIFFVFLASALFFGLNVLFEQTSQAFREGVSDKHTSLRVVGLVTDVAAVLIAFYLVRIVLRKNA